MLKAYDGNAVATLGVADVTIDAGDKSCQCTCFVVPTANSPFRSGCYLAAAVAKDVNMVRIQPIDIMVDPQAAPASLPAS